MELHFEKSFQDFFSLKFTLIFIWLVDQPDHLIIRHNIISMFNFVMENTLKSLAIKINIQSLFFCVNES